MKTSKAKRDELRRLLRAVNGDPPSEHYLGCTFGDEVAQRDLADEMAADMLDDLDELRQCLRIAEHDVRRTKQSRLALGLSVDECDALLARISAALAEPGKEGM